MVKQLKMTNQEIKDIYLMSMNNLLQKLHTAARTAKIDAEANLFARLADRLANQGQPFEKPLTESEVAILKRFL